MQKTILVTGSTDGIGLETARMLVSLGHNVLMHGRNPAKLENVEKTLSALFEGLASGCRIITTRLSGFDEIFGRARKDTVDLIRFTH